MITLPRRRIECVTYFYEFNRKGDSSGFSFPCDERGNIDFGTMKPAGYQNYVACLTGTIDVIDCGVSKREWSYVEPAEFECTCGSTVELHGFTNTCECCGRDYNMSGQLLAPREQWGEETGEHWTEIV